jgi:hypothetical protein
LEGNNVHEALGPSRNIVGLKKFFSEETTPYIPQFKSTAEFTIWKEIPQKFSQASTKMQL